MITLAIVEDHALVAQGIESLLEDEPDITLVGTATDTSGARVLLNEKQPDVVLCDVVLAGDETGSHYSRWPERRTGRLSSCSVRSRDLTTTPAPSSWVRQAT